MKTLRSPLSLFLALVIGLFAWTGCDDSGSNAETMGSMNLRLTDAPLDGVDSVVVTIDRINLVRADDDDDDADDGTDADDENGDDDADGPLTVFEGPLTIDLLSLRDSTTLLTENADVPEGTYSQLRLVLGDENYLVFSDGSRQDLTTPSAQQSGYKILLGSSFTIDESSDRIDLTLDFDASQSIVRAGASGQYILKPVIKPVNVQFSDGDLEMADIEVAGALDDVNTTDSTVTVEDVLFRVADSTEFDDGVDLDGLSTFNYASVEAFEADDGTYVAHEVEALDDDEARQSYEGTLTDVTMESVSLLGVTVLVDADTAFEGDALTGLVDLQEGDRVEVEFTTDESGNRIATSIELEDE